MERKILSPLLDNNIKEKRFNPEKQRLRFLIELYLYNLSRYRNKPYFITGANGIKKEIALRYGLEVYNLGEARNFYDHDHEEKTQRQIYDEHGENGGITPFRRSKNSPPVVVELSTDKAKEKLAIREKVIEEFLKILQKKIEDFRQKKHYRDFRRDFLEEEDFFQALISTDSDLKRLFLILEKTQKFFTTDSVWGIHSPDSQTITTDPLSDNTDFVHKPKDPEELLKILSEKASQGSHLHSISGVTSVEWVYNLETGNFEPRFRKRMVVVDYREINKRLIEFISNLIHIQSGYAMGLSSVDLIRESPRFGLNGRKVRIIIYDYTDQETGDKDYRVSLQRNKNPQIVYNGELTIDPTNYPQIIALSLGIIPS